MEPQHDEAAPASAGTHDDATLLAWLDAHYRAMPPVAALQPRAARLHGDVLHLAAPLAANVNDKGCAFGGSLVSLMTLAGWGLVTLQLRRAGLEADVFVADTEVRYRAPLYADLEARAWLDDGQDWPGLARALRSTGRASAQLLARVALPEGGDAVRARARYVAIARR